MCEDYLIRYCPFCGEYKDLSVELYGTGYFVRCKQCGSRGSARPTKAEAIADWNRRSPAWENSYEKEPRARDGHEMYCEKCVNAVKEPNEWMSTVYCKLWQIDVNKNWMCHRVEWKID